MIQVTERAAIKAKEVLERMGMPAAAVRLVVNLKGCNCSRYRMAIDAQVSPEDRVVEVDGVRFVADPEAARLLEGARLDYRADADGEGFVIEGPPASDPAHEEGCGCGHH